MITLDEWAEIRRLHRSERLGIKAIARKNHMILMTEHGIRKFANGITAINEVTRVMSAEKAVAKPGR